MKIKIQKSSLNEQRTQRDIYEVPYLMTIKQDANFEQIKTDIRAIKGVSIVSAIAGSKRDLETIEKIIYKIKFVPYGTSIKEFIQNLEKSFRQLKAFGLVSYSRRGTPKKLEN